MYECLLSSIILVKINTEDLRTKDITFGVIHKITLMHKYYSVCNIGPYLQCRQKGMMFCGIHVSLCVCVDDSSNIYRDFNNTYISFKIVIL